MRNAGIRMLGVAAVLLVSQVAVAADVPSPERATFTTKDGVSIVGDFYDARDQEDGRLPFVILLHMYQKDRTTWAPLIEKLLEKDISVLAIDLRGHGESTEVVGASGESSEDTEGSADTGQTMAANLVERVKNQDKKVFKEMDEDVWSAYLWLAKSGKVDLARFGLVGASVGCTVAMSYAARDRSVDAIVCLSPGTKYMRIRSAPHIKKLSNRALLLISSPEGRKACEDLKKYQEGAQLDVKLGKDGERDLHGTDMFGKVEGIESEIASFLERNLGEPAKQEDMVVASIKQKVYHDPESSYAARIKDRNRRWFSSGNEAEARGLRAGARRTVTLDDEDIPGGMEP